MLNWFLSRTVRQASAMRRHVRKLLNAQRDILSPEAVQAVAKSLDQTGRVIESRPSREVLQKQMRELEDTANRWLKPYPHHGWRENIEVLLVAIAVAMGIRTFFLQPFKIPTGSMQPTLYGITGKDLRDDPQARIPSLPVRIFDGFFRGTFYHQQVAENNGQLIHVSPPDPFLRFIGRQRITMHYAGPSGPYQKTHTFWFTPGDAKFPEYAGLQLGAIFQKGEDVVKMRQKSGDHLFVDRMTYNFRRPARGEIIVFQTKGIRDLPQEQFYIKRLVAFGGEEVRIGDDRHLHINGQRLDASTPRFENIYTFKGPPEDSEYSGHVHAGHVKNGNMLAPYFPDGQTRYRVPAQQYLALGDNTVNSFDSRGWGGVPRENVIGKSFFVYWPISDRFGWGHR
jgi:signal peptidase I